MARFYLSGSNSRNKEITAMGNSSGQHCHIRGWKVGVFVHAHPERNSDTDFDTLDVYLTGGSTGPTPDKLIATIVMTDDGPVVNQVEVSTKCVDCGAIDLSSN